MSTDLLPPRTEPAAATRGDEVVAPTDTASRGEQITSGDAPGRSWGPTLGLVLAVVALLSAVLGPLTGLYRTRVVLSGSMQPSFKPGDVVIATPTPLDGLTVGDVLVYATPTHDGHVVAHRIVEIVRDGAHPQVITKGDANETPDPWVAQLDEGPAWTVSGKVPAAGYVLVMLNRPWLRSLVSVIAGVGLALLWLRRIWSDRRPPPPRPPSGPGSTRPPRRRLGRRAAALTVGAWVALSGTAFAVWAGQRSATHQVTSSTLDAPTNPAVGHGPCTQFTSASLTISWTPTGSTWADGYEIQRATAAAGPYATIATVAGQSTSSYTNTGLAFTTTYYYVIKATKLSWRSTATAAVSRLTKTATCA